MLSADASAQCQPGLGAQNVTIAYIDEEDDGVPDVNLVAKERNERAKISSALADELSAWPDTELKIYPQIRVILDNHDVATGHPGTGVFTVFDTFDSTDYKIQIWADAGSTDTKSGEFRLFENTTPDFSTLQATAYGEAVSSTEVWRSGLSEETVHFCEPHPQSSFTETAVIETDRRFALLVPHGGEIEFETSSQDGPLLSALAESGIDGSLWDVQGFWHSGSHESEHWHITSKDVSPAGFPGLVQMLDETPFDADRDFQYVASLHGMDFPEEGLVLGGRGSREAKCLIGSRIRQRMSHESLPDLPVPAIYIWDHEGEISQSLEQPHASGLKITDHRGLDPGLSGKDPRNIVNQLSPNPHGAHGYGGIQIEESQSLRAPIYRDIVAEEIGRAFAEMIDKPELFAPSGTPLCDAFMADTPAPTAEIHGEAWWDTGFNIHFGHESPVHGVAVELLDGAGTVIRTTTTSPDGTYLFPGLAAGTYRVRFDVSSVIDFVPKDQGFNDTRDSDVSQLTGTTDPILLASHEVIEDIDAGLELAPGFATLGDFVWLDDGDGIREAMEDGLDDVIVELFDSKNVLLDSTVTAGGFYDFDELPLGDYVLRFAPLPGYYPTFQDVGLDDGLDSDIDANSEVAISLTGFFTRDVDAGFRLSCSRATLISFGSQWTHSATAAADWTDVDFPETGWQDESMAPFGYGSGFETSIPDTGGTAYFRIAFELEDPSLFQELELELEVSDGAIVYLNGSELARRNVPIVHTGAIRETLSMQGNQLNTGKNVIAVEVHEGGGALAFGAELTALVCQPCVSEQVISADSGTFLRQNNGSARGDLLEIQLDANTPETALLAWPISTIPADAEILHAEVELRVKKDSPNTFYLYPMNHPWDEATADWFYAEDPSSGPKDEWVSPGASDPELDHERSEPLASVTFDRVVQDPDAEDMGDPYRGVVVLNVAGRELVQSWARGERDNFGLIAPGEGANSDKLIVDSDESAHPPLLKVVYNSCVR